MANPTSHAAAPSASRVSSGTLARLAASAWARFRSKLPALRRRSAAVRDVMLFVLVVSAVVLAALVLAEPGKVILLKVLTIGYFSLLPALLYLQFSSTRTLAVWRDYVCNLYKLEADDPANLPRPPALSRFHPAWLAARKRAWDEQRLALEDGDSGPADVERKLERANQYQVKFHDLFGDVPDLKQPQTVMSLRSAHKLQVVLSTVLITLGWTFVIQPETILELSVTPSFELAHLPAIPRETIAFAFLGAYFYILQMLVRRYFQNDLKATAYINATMRIVIVVLLAWVIDPLLADATSQAMRSGLAFVIGVFPTVGWQILVQLVRKPIGRMGRSLEPTHKLGDLDGLNIWYESRLLEVGVEDMQNLTTTDIVDLMLNTRIPVDRIIDWIDQAFLYLRVEDEASRVLLRRYGIRTATDLDDTLADPALAQSLERLLNVVWKPRANGSPPSIRYVDGQPADDGLPARLRAVHTAIDTERNMQHVRAWKRYRVWPDPAAA